MILTSAPVCPVVSFKKKTTILIALAMLGATLCHAGNSHLLLQKGWAALVKDNDTQALQYFGDAYIAALQHNDTADKAEALLYMGICSYGASYSNGLAYALKAMDVYEQMERNAPLEAKRGRARCLQLISTIKSRQGNYREAIVLSIQAIEGLPDHKDTSGTLGLVYNNLGLAYHQLHMEDSSIYYHRLALAEHLITGNLAYLPNAYIQVARIEAANGNRQQSLDMYAKALAISDSTHNRQGIVLSLLGRGSWELIFNKDHKKAEEIYGHAAVIAKDLSDRSFSLKVLEQQLALYKLTGNYAAAMLAQDTMIATRDSMYSWDKRKEIRELEIQFDVAEKDRQLALIGKEKKIVVLTNYLLWGGIAVLVLLGGGVIIMLRRINRRDNLLLQAKEALIAATEQQKLLVEEQKVLKERQMQQELEYKESQLSAMALQMLQKNELMQELKDKLEEDKTITKEGVGKIISKGLTQDKEWSDFNAHFESINKLFYTRIKLAYPDISPNDLKICALIKLQLSIKEMAAILNISPDSVKTARYRLRKKLQLNTEDNLTEFITGL